MPVCPPKPAQKSLHWKWIEQDMHWVELQCVGFSVNRQPWSHISCDSFFSGNHISIQSDFAKTDVNTSTWIVLLVFSPRPRVRDNNMAEREMKRKMVSLMDLTTLDKEGDTEDKVKQLVEKGSIANALQTEVRMGLWNHVGLRLVVYHLITTT